MALTIDDKVGIQNGRQCRNLRKDQETIIELLQRIPVAAGGVKGAAETILFPQPVDGLCHPFLHTAIFDFQIANQHKIGFPPDGNISRTGPTLREMNLAAGLGAPPAGAPATGDPSKVAAARVLAGIWLSSAIPALDFFRSNFATPATAAGSRFKNIELAFRNHFKLVLSAAKQVSALPHAKLINPATDAIFLPAIRAGFVALGGVLSDHTKFQGVTAATAAGDGAPGSPAYVNGLNTFVRFTPNFNGFGPKCRAAMVLHESVHVFDAASGNNATTHISEFRSALPPFGGNNGSAYDHQRPEHAVHNPSAFAAFAIQVATGSDERFGAGRPNV